METDNIVTITLPDQSCFIVQHVGDIRLTSDLILLNVLLVPNFTYNLLSVSALLKDDQFSMTFCGNTCVIQKKFRLKMIGKVEQLNGLYILSLPTSKSLNTSVMACKTSFDV